MGKNKSQVIETEINKISSKGFGLGNFKRHDGVLFSVEVPFALPGEKVEALCLGRKKKIYNSRLREVLVPSKERISPKCKHFKECGGCRLQHIDYDNQLKLKEKQVHSLFENGELLPIVPSPNIWSYRNKMEFSFSEDKAGEKYLGLMKINGRQQVINLEECHLVSPWFMDVLEKVRLWWQASGLDAYRPYKNSGTLRTLTVREVKQGIGALVMLTVSDDDQLTEQLKKTFVESVKGENVSVFLQVQRVEKGAPTTFREYLLDGVSHINEALDIQFSKGEEKTRVMFRISPTAFFQTNPLAAQRLISLALQLADIHEQDIVYDLYCGTGTLGICAAKKAKKVIGIEICAEAVQDARENALSNGLTNYEVFSGAVEHLLASVEEKASVVLVNPPRSGLEGKALSHLVQISPEKIVYISCNPNTQARDVTELIEHGYIVEKVQPVDQFPHTVHVENIVLLRRSWDLN